MVDSVVQGVINMSINLIEKIKSGYIPHNEIYEVWCGTIDEALSNRWRLLKYLKHCMDPRHVCSWDIPVLVSIPMMKLLIFFVNPVQNFDCLIGQDRIALRSSAFCEIMDYLEKRDEQEVIKDGRSQELSDV